MAGSWEEVPSNIIDFAARDRRWAQGNLQHLRCCFHARLHWLSRLHLITGVLSYATSPHVVRSCCCLSSIISCLEAVQGYQYFESGAHTLFPVWPEYRDGEIVALLLATIVVLLAAEGAGRDAGAGESRLRRAFGGGLRLLSAWFWSSSSACCWRRR